MSFTTPKTDKLSDDLFKLIGSDWMLMTAGTSKFCNTMTANWGALGVLWERKVVFCLIRPTWHTCEYV